MTAAAAPEGERFRIERELGSGGFGVVYAAFDRKRNQPVAVKVLHQADPGRLYLFKHEFRSLADILHPNLVMLYELLAERSQWLFTMEWIDGVNFLEYVRGAGALEEASTASLPGHATATAAAASRPAPALSKVPIDYDRLRDAFAQVLRGLAALHDAGQLHRDIKPSNVLVERGGRVVLLDFGLVTQLGAGRLGEIGGTPSYMAPEQVAGRPEARSDYYAAGVMLYQCLTGRLPYPPGLRSTAAQPEPPSALEPAVPGDLERVCLDLLRYRAADRPDRARLQRLFGGPAIPEPAGAPFVGRVAELAWLDDALAATERGGAVVRVIHGASGIGKSALVRHFLDRVRVRTPRAAILGGRCFDRESVPYKSLDGAVDALSQFLRQLPSEEAAAMLPLDVPVLSHVFTVLRRVPAAADVHRRLAEPADSGELRRRAFAALRETLARLAATRPTVLCLDDLQWGDLDSVPVVEALLREPDSPPLLLLAVYRSGETQSSPPLQALAEVLAGARDFQEAELQPLADSEARHLAEALQPAGAAREQIDFVCREAAGHPYLIDLMLRHPASGGAAPPSLEEAIYSRLQELPEAGRALVETLALAGRPLPAALAAILVPAARDPALLHRLRWQRLIRHRVAGDTEEIETYHDRIRETALARLDPARRLSLHLALASAYAGDALSDPETIALHYWAGGDPGQAARYAEIAAGRAAEALAFDRAARLYRLALDCGAQSVLIRLAEALTNAGRGHEAGDAYRAAAAEARPAERINLLRLAAEQYLVSGHFDEGWETLRSVLHTVGLDVARSPAAAVFSILWRRAWLRVRGARFRPRVPAAATPGTLLKIDACASASFGLAPIDPIRGFDFQTRQLMLTLRAGDLARHARAVAQDLSGLAARGWRAWTQTDRVRREALDLAEQTGAAEARYLAASMSGVAYFFTGQWQLALDEFARAESIRPGLSARSAGETSTLRVVSGVCLAYRGDLNQLARVVPELLWEARDRGNVALEVSLHTRMAYLARLADDQPEQALRQVRAAIARWSHRGFHFQHLYTLTAEVDIHLYAGDAASARECLEARWPGLSGSAFFQVQLVYLIALDMRVRATLALARATDDARLRSHWIQQVRGDLERMERQKAPWCRGLVWLGRAALEQLEGDPRLSAPLLAQAELALDAAGMTLHAAAARRRRGELLHDTCLIASADQVFAAQRIQARDRFAGMLAPGF